jgi:hypothetical protein
MNLKTFVFFNLSDFLLQFKKLENSKLEPQKKSKYTLMIKRGSLRLIHRRFRRALIFRF